MKKLNFTRHMVEYTDEFSVDSTDALLRVSQTHADHINISTFEQGDVGVVVELTKEQLINLIRNLNMFKEQMEYIRA